MAGNAADDDLADKFVALIAEETQSFSRLVAVLVQGLVTVVRDTGVWARVIFHCSEHTGDSHVLAVHLLTCSSKHHKERDSQTHFGLRSLHLGVPVSRPWQEIWLGPSSW